MRLNASFGLAALLIVLLGLLGGCTSPTATSPLDLSTERPSLLFFTTEP